ncbi:lipoate--protein ligase family protein [Verrucomicrobia bacterium]|nr:lipoate--protein ligase family protein [Verrucomicrobiota bacterium]
MGQSLIHPLKVPASSVTEHLLWDDYLLRLCDGGRLGPSLRVWSLQSPSIVLGYSNRAAREVSLERCRQHQVPVVRRTTGGGAVLLDAGCLNYSLILPYAFHAALISADSANQYIMGRQRLMLEKILGRPVQLMGDTDLALDGRKVSGNAQRRLRSALLFHGSFLCAADIDLMEALLLVPSRQPAYRSKRIHRHFLINLNISPSSIKHGLMESWATGGAEENESAIDVDSRIWEQCIRRLGNAFQDAHTFSSEP